MKKKGLFFIVTLVFVVACTWCVGVANMKEASACGYFKRISLKKCIISLEETEFEWTGQECKPAVSVSYMGNALTEGIDYVVSYKRNIDAGEGKVIVKGIGDYRSKVKTKFRIKGLDFKSSCDVILDDANRNVKVYYKGKEVDSRFYAFYYLEDRQVMQEQVGPSGNYYIYNVVRTYTVMGKGPFEGTVIKRYMTREHDYIPN